MPNEILSIINRVNQRDIADVGYRLLTEKLPQNDEPAKYFNSDKWHTYRQESDRPWWAELKKRHNIPNGDLWGGDIQAAMFKDYATTVSETIASCANKLSYVDIDKLYAIPDSFGGAGITISSSMHDEMMKTVFESVVAFQLQAGKDLIHPPVSEIDHLVQYAALHLTRRTEAGHFVNMRDNYDRLRHNSFAPSLSDVSESQTLLERIVATAKNPRETLQKVVIDQKVRSLWHNLGVEIPSGAEVKYEFQSDQNGNSDCTGMSARVKDMYGYRWFRWEKKQGYDDRLILTRQVVLPSLSNKMPEILEASLILMKQYHYRDKVIIELKGADRSGKIPGGKGDFSIEITGGEVMDTSGSSGRSLDERLNYIAEVTDLPMVFLRNTLRGDYLDSDKFICDFARELVNSPRSFWISNAFKKS